MTEAEDFLVNIQGFLQKDVNLSELNARLKTKTGIAEFFGTIQEFEAFKKFVSDVHLNLNENQDMGDFQTPLPLANQVCGYLVKQGLNPDIIIEPTCGKGNFIISALKSFSALKYIYCVELQKQYEWLFKLNLLHFASEKDINVNIEFHLDNIFTHQFSNSLMQVLDSSAPEFLIIGNPPWITNSELSILNSTNVPTKSNVKRVRGIEAITGKGNFDIAEYIITRMIRQFSYRKGKIAMLCKTSVIRNIMKDLQKLDLNLANINTIVIDAKKEFNINADACLFLAEIGVKQDKVCTISSLHQPTNPSKKFGWVGDRFVSDIEKYKHYQYLDGQSHLIWRQGVKHDAMKVLILTMSNNTLLNGFQEEVEIEKDLLFPFLKGSELRTPVIKESNKKIIVTQTVLKEATDYIAVKFPQLWNYLTRHASILDGRKSVIYKGRPRFSIFGIGDYAFKPYKIAISGFYKNPVFSLIVPIENRPVMLDDTSYYLFFDKFQDAFFNWVLLSLESTKEFLSSIIFLDSKRPYTKDSLMRLDLGKLAKTLSFDVVLDFYQKNLRKYAELEFDETLYSAYFQ